MLLVVGAWRNDQQIERNMGVAAAEVLSAGPRRSTIEFVTPDRVTYRPELGVLYPSELDTGMRIYVEYDKNNPGSGAGPRPRCVTGDHPGRVDRGGAAGWLPAAALALLAVPAAPAQPDQPCGVAEQFGEPVRVAGVDHFALPTRS